MMLRTKLFLAQAPLAVALVVVGMVSFRATENLSMRAQAILKDNYRSVLAAQRMKEYVERLDSTALYGIVDVESDLENESQRYRQSFEEELAAQEANITEPGERERTANLRASWEAYRRALDVFFALRAGGDRKAYYAANLRAGFAAVNKGADGILDVNQDSMVAKSDVAAREAGAVRRLLVLLSLTAFGCGVFTSLWLTRRLLNPLTSLTLASRRIGEGDLATRAPVRGGDEIASLAAEFNQMAEHLAEYRRSSLGELLQAQQASQAAIDSLPDPVLVFDNESRVLSFNLAAESLIPALVSSPDSLGQVEPALRDGIMQVRRHIVEGRGAFQPRGYEEAIRHAARDGDRYFLPRGSPVYGEAGEVAGATVVLQDVTKLRRFDELKNDLVATVAHEMKTPLTSLGMGLHICLDQGIGALNEKQADLLFAAREDCERLQTIVDEILDLARIQSGKVELHRRAVPVRDLVEHAVSAHQSEIAERRLTLELEIFDSVKVLADPDRIQLVLGNFVSNAVKYSPPATVLRVGAREEGTGVRFYVTDQGPGLPKDAQARIFEKFFRSTQQPGGAGLGLYIAREIVQAHEGQLGVESEPGRGSTFWFRIPKAA